MAKIQTFCFGSMFRDISPAGVRRMAKKVRCCETGARVDENTWLAIVKRKGGHQFCLPEHANGHTCVPTRELVEAMVPGFGNLHLTVLERYSTKA